MSKKLTSYQRLKIKIANQEATILRLRRQLIAVCADENSSEANMARMEWRMAKRLEDASFFGLYVKVHGRNPVGLVPQISDTFEHWEKDNP